MGGLYTCSHRKTARGAQGHSRRNRRHAPASPLTKASQSAVHHMTPFSADHCQSNKSGGFFGHLSGSVCSSSSPFQRQWLKVWLLASCHSVSDSGTLYAERNRHPECSRSGATMTMHQDYRSEEHPNHHPAGISTLWGMLGIAGYLRRPWKESVMVSTSRGWSWRAIIYRVGHGNQRKRTTGFGQNQNHGGEALLIRILRRNSKTVHPSMRTSLRLTCCLNLKMLQAPCSLSISPCIR